LGGTLCSPTVAHFAGEYPPHHENRPLRSSELIALLEKRVAQIHHHHNKVQYFSAFLTLTVRYRSVISYKLKGVRGYFYLLPQWVHKEGKPKPEFLIVMI